MKFLIAGLGNIGNEYAHTRHNIGFDILDALASASGIFFESTRLAYRAELRHKGRQFVLIKPTTYMNLSGKAVNYWLQAEKLTSENLLVVTDDIALPFGKIRMRSKGSAGGHNGLKNIQAVLGHSNYPRLRFGVGSDFHPGQQVNYVLGQWDADEQAGLNERIKLASEAILAFGAVGLNRAMNTYNAR